MYLEDRGQGNKKRGGRIRREEEEGRCTVEYIPLL
jgi:hypothetical protein